MDESLYEKFLEDEVEDISKAMLHNGIDGLLFNFEQWLRDNGHIK